MWLYSSFSFVSLSFFAFTVNNQEGSLYFCYIIQGCICTPPLGPQWSLLFLTGTGFYNRSNNLHVNIFKETDNVSLKTVERILLLFKEHWTILIQGHAVRKCFMVQEAFGVHAKSPDLLESSICSIHLMKGTSVTRTGKWRTHLHPGHRQCLPHILPNSKMAIPGKYYLALFWNCALWIWSLG
jgi:hypothetical protein